METLVFGWWGFGVAIACSAAQRRGLSRYPAMLAGFLLGPFAVLLYCARKRRPCPSCSHPILPTATICRHCGCGLAEMSLVKYGAWTVR